MSSNRPENKKAQISAAIKTLKESSSLQEKCKALSHIQSAATKSAAQDIPTESQSREICKLVINAFASGNKILHPEASSALIAILKCYKDRKLNLFNELMQINFENRLKIFQLFEGLQDETMKAVTRDLSIVDFLKDCLTSVNPEKMDWLSPTSCTDNIKPLQSIEYKTLSPAEQIEEKITICILDLIYRLYKLSTSPSYTECTKLSTLFMDKVATLAYMGHKRQRTPAIKVLQLPNMGNHIRSSSPTIWQEYKSTLQNTYCQRMAVLVSACDPDWSILWTTSIQLLGTELHRGAGLINNLLSVEEKAFKSVDTVVRRQAFLSWKLIVDNFALDEQELATARRVKLLCIPLNAKNSKTESMTLTKLEVWWHLIYKLNKHIDKFTNPVLTQFLNFCFGPLGDTPLLSSKSNVIASPGKRFSKTKLVALDALMQLLTDNTEDLKLVASSLEEKLPAPVSTEVFQQCFKPFVHSIGEVCLTLAQPGQREYETKVQIIAVLWRTLLARVKDVKDEGAKVQMYKEIMLLVVELSEHSDNKVIIRDCMLDTVLPNLDEFPVNYIFHLESIVGLMSIVTRPAILNKITKKHQDLIRRLLWRGVRASQTIATYVPNALEVFGKLVTQLDSVEPEIENLKGASILWNILCEMVTKYMSDGQEMNEGDAASHDFKTVQILIKFPFSEKFAPEFWQVKKATVHWKGLYKQFDLQASLVPTVKPNECVSFAISVIHSGVQLDRRCAGFAVTCLDGILTTMNYKHVLDGDGFLQIVKLMNDLCILNLADSKNKEAEAALRELSSVLITLYGHAPNKVASCLDAVRPAMEHMLKPCKEESLVKEISSTWETIMSIFRGIGGLLSPDLIVAYQEAIRLALRHADPEIVSQTLSCLETEEYMNGPTKDLVKSFLREVDSAKGNKKATNVGITDPQENGQKQIKPPKLTGSFLNRKTTASPKPATPTQKPKDGRKSPFFPEPESQEYVVIKSDFKFDAHRLTEHQRESLSRRREDIPALYNDLSQSCSQDTQNIQAWFDKKKNEIDQAGPKNSSSNSEVSVASAAPVSQTEPQTLDVGDSNKENKLDSVAAADIVVSDASGVDKDKAKSKEGTEQEAGSDKKGKEKKADGKQTSGNISPDEILSPNNEPEDNTEPTISVAKKLDFESRAEFPEQESPEQKSSETPSTSKGSEVAEEKTKKLTKAKGEAETVQKDTKRGVKRKAAVAVSDSDSEDKVSGRRKRKIAPSTTGIEAHSDSDSVKSAEGEGTIKQLSQRTKNEMSRLQINMVFDSKQFSTLPSRRRSKVQYEDEGEGSAEERETPEASISTRQRALRNTPQETAKVRVKVVEKDPKNLPVPKPGKKRGRRPKTPMPGEQPPEETPREASPSQMLSPSLDDAITGDQKTGKTKSPESKDDKEALEPEKEVVAEELNSTENNLENSASQICNDSEEIVESSQASSPGSTILDKKYNNKQCFIKINKLKGVQPAQSTKLDVGKEKTKMIKETEPENPVKVCTGEISNAENAQREATLDEDDPMIEKPEKEKEKTPSIPNPDDQSTQNKPDVLPPVTSEVNEDRVVVNETNSSPPESRPPPTDASFSPIRLPGYMINSSSPKNSMKRFSKQKSVTTQGRTAHMLGLVTKQAIAESRPEVFIEDEIPLVKRRGKDGEEEIASGKKERLGVLREPERLGSPSGSRQEKIFNKMRTVPDNEPTPISSLFGNLKNDGEKSSPGTNSEKERNAMENSIGQTEKGGEKIDDDNNTSPIQEREMLPMLEWSSANPPSLTASPSASILKRQRQLQIENDPESPSASKRKRVSFADPPVSKEMGYEIPASTPPHRMSKVSGSRMLLPRKDSPIRLKQTKIKTVQSSPGRTDKESEMEVDRSVINDTESQATRTLSGEYVARKIDDDSDNPVIIFPETQDLSSNIVNDDKRADSFSQAPRANESAKVTLENLNMEIEIASRSRDTRPKDEDEDKDIVVIKEVNTLGKPKNDETETQRDIFETTEVNDGYKSPKNDTKRSQKAKTYSDVINIRCVDTNILTNSSPIENNLVRSQSSMEVLEDTVDIQNVTGLNSTANSDEMFCSRPVRTSTQSTEADTLPVTDSVFSNLPLSQNTQTTNDTMDLDQPELLDSTRSIYPSLMESSAPINSVIGYLVDPIWKSHLSNYLHSKGIETVGNLAQLSEREINWIPVKRSPKVPFVRSVLQHFERSILSLPSTASTVDASQESDTTTPNASMSSLPPTSTPIAQSSTLYTLLSCKPPTANSLYESLTESKKATKSTEVQVSIEELLDDVDPSVVLKNGIRRSSAESILTNYKLKMKNMTEEDLERETIKMLGITMRNQTEANLKLACRAAGLSKVLGRLPDIFSQDKQFFTKVLLAYKRKIRVADCMEGLELEEIKTAICQRCTSSDLAEMLSKKLKEEEDAGVTTPMTELSSLQAMLKRMPKDLIISHTVANEELISPLVVLDIALQNNIPDDISSALKSQPRTVKDYVFGDLCTVEALSTQVEGRKFPEETLIEMFKTIGKGLDAPKLLDVFSSIMKEKFLQKKPTSSNNS